MSFTATFSVNFLSRVLEVNAVDVDIVLQEYLIELQSDITAQARFKNNKHFWISSEIANNFPHLWEEAKLFFIRFPSSYIVESGFSRVLHLLSKARNGLDIVRRDDTFLSTSLRL
jgi:hypothetical protein